MNININNDECRTLLGILRREHERQNELVERIPNHPSKVWIKELSEHIVNIRQKITQACKPGVK